MRRDWEGREWGRQVWTRLGSFQSSVLGVEKWGGGGKGLASKEEFFPFSWENASQGEREREADGTGEQQGEGSRRWVPEIKIGVGETEGEGGARQADVSVWGLEDESPSDGFSFSH